MPLPRTIFISYAHSDPDFTPTNGRSAESCIPLLQESLQKRNFTMLWDQGIPPGDDWRRKIDEMIRNSMAMIALIDQRATTSQYIFYEYGVALGAEKKIIPIMLFKPDNIYKIHPRLETFQRLDFSGDVKLSALEKELDSLEAGLADTSFISNDKNRLYKSLAEVIHSSLQEARLDDVLFNLAAHELISDEEFAILSNAYVERQKRFYQFRKDLLKK